MNTLFTHIDAGDLESPRNTTALHEITRENNIVKVTLHARRDSKFSSLDNTANKHFNEWQKYNYKELGYKSSTITGSERADHNAVMFFYTVTYKLNGMAEDQPTDPTPTYAELQNARFNALTEVITLRAWLNTLKGLPDEEASDIIEQVENALVKYVNFGTVSMNPLIMGAFVQMGILQDKHTGAAILDVYQAVCEKL